MLVYFQPEIILVTGTAGKTSTKEMIFSVLSESKKFQGDIGKSFGNLNTKTGVPLAIFQIKIYRHLFRRVDISADECSNIKLIFEKWFY